MQAALRAERGWPATNGVQASHREGAYAEATTFPGALSSRCTRISAPAAPASGTLTRHLPRPRQAETRLHDGLRLPRRVSSLLSSCIALTAATGLSDAGVPRASRAAAVLPALSG